MKVVTLTAGLLFLAAVGLFFLSETLHEIDEAIGGAFYE